MIANRKFWIGSLLATMMLVSMAFVPAASAQQNIKTNDKPPELEQGLIDPAFGRST